MFGYLIIVCSYQNSDSIESDIDINTWKDTIILTYRLA